MKNREVIGQLLHDALRQWQSEHTVKVKQSYKHPNFGPLHYLLQVEQVQLSDSTTLSLDFGVYKDENTHAKMSLVAGEEAQIEQKLFDLAENNEPIFTELPELYQLVF